MGRQDFTQAAQLIQTVASQVGISGRKGDVKMITATAATTIADGASETITVTPTAGKRWTIQGVRFSVTKPVGAAAGSHKLLVNLGTSSLSLLWGTAAYNKSLFYLYSQLCDDALANLTTEVPSDKNAQVAAFKGLQITASHTLQFVYTNNTGVEQTNTRTVLLSVAEEDITS